MARLVRRSIQVVLAAFVVATAGLALPAAPAVAAGCPSAHGVTVVVDFHELGGGVQTGCVAGGGGDTAASLFPAAGFSLSYVQRQPGFVCRIDGLPSDSPCVNTPPEDAYWALFWSDGKSGSWSYATSGAGGQRVPDGGYVAFSWNGSSARSAPGYTPAPHATATPTTSPTRDPAASSHPSQHPSAAPSAAPSATPSASSESPSASPSKSSSAAPTKRQPRDEKSHQPKATVTETTTALPTEETSADAVPTAAEPSEPDEDGLPTWVAPAVILVLFAGAGTAAVVRRRRGVPGA